MLLIDTIVNLDQSRSNFTLFGTQIPKPCNLLVESVYAASRARSRYQVKRGKSHHGGCSMLRPCNQSSRWSVRSKQSGSIYLMACLHLTFTKDTKAAGDLTCSLLGISYKTTQASSTRVQRPAAALPHVSSLSTVLNPGISGALASRLGINEHILVAHTIHSPDWRAVGRGGR